MAYTQCRKFIIEKQQFLMDFQKYNNKTLKSETFIHHQQVCDLLWQSYGLNLVTVATPLSPRQHFLDTFLTRRKLKAIILTGSTAMKFPPGWRLSDILGVIGGIQTDRRNIFTLTKLGGEDSWGWHNIHTVVRNRCQVGAVS